MPISIKDKVIREISMMVRKGSIQFDMNDRPVLDLKRTDGKTGRKINYCVGSIGRDEATSGLFFTLYTSDGKFVPSVDGPRSIDSLYNKELLSVRKYVSRYFDMAVNRAKNLRGIIEFVNGHPDGYDFVNGVKPSAFVDPALDGKLVEIKVDSIFYPDPSISSDRSLLFSGSDASGRKITGSVQSLNDHAVTNMVTCLGLDSKISLGRTEEVGVDGPGRKDKVRQMGL